MLRDYRGAIHVHSTLSDGADTPEEIIRAARSARLDFLVLTDHPGPRPNDDRIRGWHDGLLVVVGSEPGSPRRPHLIVIGANATDALDEIPVQDALARVKARGGLSFIAHPRGKWMIGVRIPSFRAWDNPDYTGIELWSFMHDWIEDFRWREFLSFYREAHSKITGPHPEVLAAWDRASMTRPVSGIAGLDAVGKPLIGPWFKLFPYPMLFGTTLTHVLVEEFTGDARADEDRVVRALARARCYMAYHVLGDPAGFRFFAATDRGEFQMGDSVPLAEAPRLRAELPARADMRLVANGLTVGEIAADRWDFTPTLRGPHRLEVRLSSRPWIFSNHIHVT